MHLASEGSLDFVRDIAICAWHGSRDMLFEIENMTEGAERDQIGITLKAKNMTGKGENRMLRRLFGVILQCVASMSPVCLECVASMYPVFGLKKHV